MKIVSILRDDERIIEGTKVIVGMVISTDTIGRDPKEIYLVTDVAKTGTILGVYLGQEENRNRGVQHIVGCGHKVLHFPKAALALHGLG